MKVLLVSAFLPTRHNLNGPSALPYYLSRYRPENIQLDLVRFVAPSDVHSGPDEDQDPVFDKVIRVPQTPKYYYYALRFLQKTGIFRRMALIYYKFLPTSALLKQIAAADYDLIWIYPNTLYPWYQKLKGSDIVLTGPDCSFLHHTLVTTVYKEGSIESDRPMKDDVRITHMKTNKKKSYLLEKKWSASEALIHVVGEDDQKMYAELGADKHSFFSPHPHYSFKKIHTPLSEVNGKLNVLITGVNHSLYIGNFLDRIVNVLVRQDSLKKDYRFTFIGKGFEDPQRLMKEAGYETTLTKWVDSYEDALADANIQLFPIIVGTGTKGKVLSALATGLLCIGTKYAFENIAIDTAEDCCYIENEHEIPEALARINLHRDKYARMAQNASVKVQIAHSPETTAKLFWDSVSGYFGNKKNNKTVC